MKTFLLSIAILLILVAAFSAVEGRMEFEYPFGNWAVPGKTGEPVPGEGNPGEVNTFSFGKSEAAQGAQPSPAEGGTQEYCPITAEVVTENAAAELPANYLTSVVAILVTVMALFTAAQSAVMRYYAVGIVVLGIFVACLALLSTKKPGTS